MMGTGRLKSEAPSEADAGYFDVVGDGSDLSEADAGYFDVVGDGSDLSEADAGYFDVVGDGSDQDEGARHAIEDTHLNAEQLPSVSAGRR